ncbi:MAG TPA: Gfo/Idh/MocA family oxidoreductase, partial [Cyclobacteriaceae bacterium]|nr:Gfo/Idh/MocA family oxidoreductase [Cyclobacteriaceae bacterium]
MSSSSPIRTALLSYGMSGEVFHGPLLAAHRGFELTSVLQRKSDTARSHYQSVKIVRTMDEVLRDPEIELVVVNTPNETHFDFTTKVLEAGKHAIVEKPFTTTVSEGEKLIALAKSKGKVLSV